MDEVPFRKNENIIIAPFHKRETELTYYVTVPVEEIDLIPESMVGFTIPEKSYVFCRHNGDAAEINNTYKNMLSWMEEYGYEQDFQALCFEIYKSDRKEDLFSENGLPFEIYIPVKKY